MRRFLSRSLWLARLLRLPVSEGAPNRPGLIMVQIDGLSQRQFATALERGELPFLRRLIRREHYHSHAHYAGLPSSTPAVQAELFYGVKSAVPAFSFRDHESKQLVRMYEAEAAAKIEQRYSGAEFEPLLKDGSSYSNIYTGGAAESHFCASSVGWGPALRSANPLVLFTFLLTNFYSFLRIVVLFFLELGLSVVDLVRGVIKGQDFFQELKFIPARVGVSILLRELCVIGGKIDISRGLPVIHLNFFGYDEQSHRRGPSSLFAHWTLKGIDNAISRLWHAANHAPWRHYDLWIYSDHGQAKVTPYHKVHGYSLAEALDKSVAVLDGAPGIRFSEERTHQHPQRVRVLGERRTQRLFPASDITTDDNPEPHWVMTGLGPVGHIYAPKPLSDQERDIMSRELAHTHGVPVVLMVRAPGVVCARTEQGEFWLPQDSARLFGAGHPFLAVIGEDLVRLCEHEDAGDFVVLGWREGISALTFAGENGAHAGLVPEETNGFALLPSDAPLPEREHTFLRPMDLRRAALHHLGRAEPEVSVHLPQRESTSLDALRVMTYNVHSCIGMDGKMDIQRIARVIARARPDVVALQELDVGRERSFGMDQAHQIAHYLEMEFHFHPAIHLEEERYGDAILTRLPYRLIKTGALPGLREKPELEPRGALWVAVEFNGREVQVINTHLGLNSRERLAQVRALLGDEWLGHERCRGPVIVCGDFNALPSSPAYRLVCGQLSDVQGLLQGHRPKGTFISRFPKVRIDHIFVSEGLKVTGIETYQSQLARTASDHLPLLAEIGIPL
jgi:endonuclease/exonuclease/phosphatase family metal-dependent hydrolase